jgi:hypothetical protein
VRKVCVGCLPLPGGAKGEQAGDLFRVGEALYAEQRGRAAQVRDLLRRVLRYVGALALGLGMSGYRLSIVELLFRGAGFPRIDAPRRRQGQSKQREQA